MNALFIKQNECSSTRKFGQVSRVSSFRTLKGFLASKHLEIKFNEKNDIFKTNTCKSICDEKQFAKLI